MIYYALLQIIGSLVEFEGNMVFEDNANSSTHGVSLHMQSFAQMRLKSGLRVQFSKNTGA